MPEIGEPLYDDDATPLSYGFAVSAVGPDGGDAPAIFLPGRGGWTRRALPPPPRPLGFTPPRAAGRRPPETPLCD